MLDLDSPRWAELQHAYGPADDIPDLLRDLERFAAGETLPPNEDFGEQKEPWFSLWSALCHQGDSCTAAFAALPHIVRIAFTAAGPVPDYFHLPGAIEVARDLDRVPVTFRAYPIADEYIRDARKTVKAASPPI